MEKGDLVDAKISLVDIAQSKRYITLQGLEYCTMFNGALLDAFVWIDSLGGCTASANPTRQHLVNLIDESAKQVFKKVSEYSNDIQMMVC